MVHIDGFRNCGKDGSNEVENLNAAKVHAMSVPASNVGAFVKFMFSTKATKFDKIFTIDLTFT